MSDKPKLDITKLYEIHDAIITDELSDDRMNGNRNRTDTNCEHVFGPGYAVENTNVSAFKCKNCGFVEYFITRN